MEWNYVCEVCALTYDTTEPMDWKTIEVEIYMDWSSTSVEMEWE